MLTIRPNQKAVEFIRAKAAVSPDNYGKLPEQLRIKAFTSSAAADVHTLRSILDKLADLPAGADWNKTKREIAGMIGGGAETDRETRRFMRARAKLIVQTAGRQAYAAARYAEMKDQADVFPYWRYVAVGDERTRPTHQALDGKILPADDPFWHTHYPPWDFGCRCTCEPVTESEAQDAGIADAKRIPGAQPDGYRFDPSDLNQDPDELMDSYGEDWDGFAASMRAMTVDAPRDGGNGTETAWDFWWRGEVAKKDGAELSRFAGRTGNEMAVIRDAATGRVVETLRGDARGVEGVAGIYDRAAAEGKSVRGIHVHPNGGPYPSPSDALMAMHAASDGERIAGYGIRSALTAREKNQVLRSKVEKWQNDLDSGKRTVAEWQAWLNGQHRAGTIRLETEI